MKDDRRLKSFALRMFPQSDVLCAYAAPVFQGFADQFGRWIQIGSFVLPQDLAARLWVIGFRTPGVTAYVKLFGPESVSGSQVQIASDTDAEALSARVELSAGVRYQIAACAIGTPGAENYMVVHTASLAPAGDA